MAYVWGQGGTDQTPLFARWIGNIIRTLYEKKLTLIESEFLAKQMRYILTAELTDKSARQDWQFANTLNPRDFESQIGSTVNRLHDLRDWPCRCRPPYEAKRRYDLHCR